MNDIINLVYIGHSHDAVSDIFSARPYHEAALQILLAFGVRGSFGGDPTESGCDNFCGTLR